MRKKQHSPEQIIAKLREAEAGLNAGQELAAVCRQMEISEQTYYRWRPPAVALALAGSRLSRYGLRRGVGRLLASAPVWRHHG